jgi:hypothetical protein
MKYYYKYTELRNKGIIITFENITDLCLGQNSKTNKV